MIMLLKLLLAVGGVYFLAEGLANIYYWHSKPTRTLFQLGRLLRAVFGFVLILLAVWGP